MVKEKRSLDEDGWSRTALLCLGQTKGKAGEVVDERGSVQPQREYHVKHMDGREKEREVTQRR